MLKKVFALTVLVVGLAFPAFGYEVPKSFNEFGTDAVTTDVQPFTCGGSGGAIFSLVMKDGDGFKVFAEDGRYIIARYPGNVDGLPETLYFGTMDPAKPDVINARSEKFNPEVHKDPCDYLTAKDA